MSERIELVNMPHGNSLFVEDSMFDFLIDKGVIYLEHIWLFDTENEDVILGYIEEGRYPNDGKD